MSVTPSSNATPSPVPFDGTLDDSPRVSVWAPDGLSATGLAAAVRESLGRAPHVHTGVTGGLPRLRDQIVEEADVLVVAAGTTAGPARQVARAVSDSGLAVVWIDGGSEDRQLEEDGPVAAARVRRSDTSTGEHLRRVLHELLSDEPRPPSPADRTSSSTDDEQSPDDELTADLGEREIEVLRLLAEGYDTSEVAARLYYSERTVKNVVSRAIRHLGVRNRAQAVAVATRSGLL